jgi:hypothetical protein
MTRNRLGRDFPRLGLMQAPISDAARAPFFVTGPYVRLQRLEDGSEGLEGPPFHAKQMGTAVTLCGRPAGAWRKLWDVGFSAGVASRPGACHACADLAWGIDVRSRG